MEGTLFMTYSLTQPQLTGLAAQTQPTAPPQQHPLPVRMSSYCLMELKWSLAKNHPWSHPLLHLNLSLSSK
jgi:hypothetical protein